MTTNDKPLSRNFDKEKIEIDLQHIRAEEIVFYNKVKLSVTIKDLLLSSDKFEIFCEYMLLTSIIL